jgi:hypothetical protein
MDYIIVFPHTNTMNIDHKLPLAFSFPAPISHWFLPRQISAYLYAFSNFSLDLASAYERKYVVFVFMRLAYFITHHGP